VLAAPARRCYVDGVAAQGSSTAETSWESLPTAKAVAWAEQESERLKVEFEKYFIGVERMPPTADRDTWKRRVLTLKSTGIQNTALRFRVQQLVAKMQAYDRYWTRSMKDIEEGRDRRQRFRLTLHERERAAAELQKAAGRAGAAAGDEGDPDTSPATAPQGAGPRAAPPPGQAVITDARLRPVYEAFLKARPNHPQAKMLQDHLAGLKQRLPR
jgi:hypothetical protein